MDITKDCETLCDNIYKELVRNKVNYNTIVLVIGTIRKQYNYYEQVLKDVNKKDLVSVCVARDGSHCNRCIYQGDVCNSFCISKGVLFPKEYKPEIKKR